MTAASLAACKEAAGLIKFAQDMAARRIALKPEEESEAMHLASTVMYSADHCEGSQRPSQ